MHIARIIAEHVVRPVYGGTGLEDPGVGLYIGEECKFVLPATFVFGQGASQGRDHLLEELRKVIEAAVLQYGIVDELFEKEVAPPSDRQRAKPLDAAGIPLDTNEYYRGKFSR